MNNLFASLLANNTTINALFNASPIRRLRQLSLVISPSLNLSFDKASFANASVINSVINNGNTIALQILLTKINTMARTVSLLRAFDCWSAISQWYKSSHLKHIQKP